MTTLVDTPARVDGVQIIGAMEGSGYRTPPALVRRPDGQVLQLTPLLFLVLSAIDGRRGLAEIAAAVGAATGRGVAEADVRTLVDDRLRPLGLVRAADGSDPVAAERLDPLIALKPKIAITNPRTTRRVTDPFRVLFRGPVVVPVVVGFVAVVTWVFFERGLAASTYDAFERPHLLLLVFAVTVLSGGFHEFGHAAAARYGGASPGAMGAGLYIVWPAFYTDVTDSYRLGRVGRIRTDLGGLYFNAIVVCLTFGWWAYTGWEALLLLVATQVLQMTQQLLPLLRFDGYHLLADLAGVPDLYHRIKPTLLGLLPHRWKSPENRAIKPWSRAVIIFWVLITVPMMILMLLALVGAAPRVLGTAGHVIREDAEAVKAAWISGHLVDVAAGVLQVLGVVLPVVATVLILGRIGLQWFRGLARWSGGSVRRRAVAAGLSAALVSGLAWAWWPYPGNYRPISPEDDGLFTRLVSGAAERPPVARPIGTAARARLASGEPLNLTLEEGAPVPTEDDPMLTMVLVPAEGTTPGAEGGQAADGSPATASEDDAWVFPFDKPLPPEEGDNQALAVNTTDGSVRYDVAFALVWAEGDEVLNVNEAHAYASCSGCVTVAVAFQVVLVMDDAQVIVPQNLAVAANYDCFQCTTAAVAHHLVLSVGSEPGQEQLHELADVWARLVAFGQNIASYSLSEIAAQLEGFQQEIIAILGDAAVVDPQPSPTESPSSTTSPSPTETTSPTPDETTSPSPSPTETTASPSPTETTTTSPTETETTTTSPSPSPSPTETETASPSPSPTTSPSESPSPTP